MSASSRHYYLNAILSEIGHLRAFVAGYNYDDYTSDLKTQYAVERAILNISEAVRNLEKHGKREDPSFNLNTIGGDIEWAKIKGIGNVMRHDYENVTANRIWSVITSHLSQLETACYTALEHKPDDP